MRSLSWGTNVTMLEFRLKLAAAGENACCVSVFTSGVLAYPIAP
jgi:hypothetical protein